MGLPKRSISTRRKRRQAEDAFAWPDIVALSDGGCNCHLRWTLQLSQLRCEGVPSRSLVPCSCQKAAVWNQTYISESSLYFVLGPLRPWLEQCHSRNRDDVLRVPPCRPVRKRAKHASCSFRRFCGSRTTALYLLQDRYGMTKVYGIIGGYKGCVQDDQWVGHPAAECTRWNL